MTIENQVSLKDFTTIKIGGKAKHFCRVAFLEELEDAILWAKGHKQKVFILGGGSNVIFNDEGFDGLVVRLENREMKKLEDDQNGHYQRIQVGAGQPLSAVVRYFAEQELDGLGWAAGIPGTLGGAIRGNAGAFGREMSDVVELVEAIEMKNEGGALVNVSGKIIVDRLRHELCRFRYRGSVFKQEGYIIWSAVLKGFSGKKEALQAQIKETIAKRAEKHPSLGEFPSAGSFFKNPIASERLIKLFEQECGVKCKDNKVPAGWLIESAGLKGKTIGSVKVSEKQANFIVNTGGATFKEVVMLISIIKQKVRNQFGAQLEEEVELVY